MNTANNVIAFPSPQTLAAYRKPKTALALPDYDGQLVRWFTPDAPPMFPRVRFGFAAKTPYLVNGVAFLKVYEITLTGYTSGWEYGEDGLPTADGWIGVDTRQVTNRLHNPAWMLPRIPKENVLQKAA